jgi:hypothetical protein
MGTHIVSVDAPRSVNQVDSTTKPAVVEVVKGNNDLALFEMPRAARGVDESNVDARAEAISDDALFVCRFLRGIGSWSRRKRESCDFQID